MPKTDPDWVMVAPLDLASIGKNGGSSVAQTPQMQQTHAIVAANKMDLGFDIV